MHEPDRLRFLSKEHPRRQQEFRGAGVADQPGQQPRHPVLREQPPTRERGGELRPGRGEAHVGHQRLQEPDPGGGAVHRGDDRLGNLERKRLRKTGTLGERRTPGDPAQRVGVEPGAEPSAGTGHHDGPHLRVGGGLGQEPEVALLHGQGPRVEAVGAVQREEQNPVVNAVGEDDVSVGRRGSGHEVESYYCYPDARPGRRREHPR